jgi:predicted DNA binding protein
MGGVIAEFDLPAEEFALSETLVAHDGAEFEVERVVAHTDRAMPFVWVRADDTEAAAIEETLQGDSTVESVDLLTDLGEERLYRMEWVAHVETLVHVLVEEDGTVLAASGSGRNDAWHLRVLFPEHGAISRTNEFCEDHGLAIDLRRVYQLDDGRKGRFGLTDDQQSTLVAAFEHGFYEVPRSTSMEELAAELDVSHQALSERFRRAHGSLVENAVVIGDESGAGGESRDG